MTDESEHILYRLCSVTDPSKCVHEHTTLYDFDPLLGALADAIEKHGIKRGGVTYADEK